MENDKLPPTVPAAQDPRSTAALQVRCIACRKPIDEADAFCRYCGKRQGVADAWYYRPVWILLLGLFVLGPFALPLVWLSPSMDRRTKYVIGGVLVLYTAMTLYYTWKLTALVSGEFLDMNRQFQQLH